MPNKTIYVSDRDLALFDQAQSLAGGKLSAAIAQALKEYVRAAEVARLHQYDSHTVTVGPAGSRRKKRFTAVCLARWQQPAGKAGAIEDLVAYWTVGEESDAVLEIYDTIDDFAEHVPPEFAKIVADAIAAADIEELDI
jgi:hypothetical protein